jgi:hypothetical protein
MLGEQPDLLEAARVRQPRNPLARRQLATLMLFINAALATAFRSETISAMVFFLLSACLAIPAPGSVGWICWRE